MAEKKAPAKKAEPAKATTTAKKAEPAKTATTAKKAEPAKTATTAKKTEPAKTATTVKKAEPVKTATTAKKAEPAKTATTAKKTEPAKTTTTAKKAEPAKTATTAKKTEPAKTETTAKKAEPAKTETTAKKAEPAKTATTEKKPSFGDRKSSATAGVATSLMSDNDHSKPAKPAKPAKSTKKSKASKPDKNTGDSDEKKKKKIIIASIASACVFVVLLSLILGLTLGLKGGKNPVDVLDRYDLATYKTNTVVRYGEQTTGTVDRYKPVEGIHDERSAFDAPLFAGHDKDRYPTYNKNLGYVLGDNGATARSALINEAAYLCAWGTAGANRGGAQTPDKYTKIDENGFLYQYKNNAWIHSLLKDKTEYVESNYRQLYKHTGSIGLYGGNVSDDEQGIVKEITFSRRDYLTGYGVTGLYAPAGEVIKVQMSKADMDATGGIVIHIGQALYNGQANNIWTAKNTMPRFPLILTTLEINKSTTVYDEETQTYTGYIGSFIGGPIYVRNESATFNVTISGGVAYSHFILGYTTPEQFEQNKKSTAPYFDLEVWDNGVLHSGPKAYASKFSYDDLYNAAVLWDKVASVTASGGSKYGIVFIYDPFVAAGAAVAFPGRNSVNCPTGWMSSSLNYNAIVTSGSWGNFHEYHHNFQNYGLGSGADGEVTNNGLNLVSYSLFTNISSARQISGYGGAGLSGWNQYTSATWALNRVNTKQNTSTNGLANYATLLHNFGQDQYIKARGATGVTNYLNRWATNTHYDMTYYASMVSNYGGGTYAPSQAVKNANYPLFVPVSSVYQTGRTYNYDGEKREITTMRPYVIPFGDPFTVDLNEYVANSSGQYLSGSIVIADGFKFSIKNIDNQSGGTFVETDKSGVYTFTPNTKDLLTGKIYVTLEITTADGKHEWNGHALDDVDLVLQFQQSHEKNKTVLKRTTYTYAEGKAYTDAVTAYEAGFKGYDNKNERAHTNPVQNANTDIWFYPNTETYHTNNPNAPQEFFARKNTIEVVDGKLYFGDDGKYRIYLRGRKNCAVYFSLDGNNYTLGAAVKNGSGSAFYLADKNSYFDIEFNQGSYTATVYVGNTEAKEIKGSLSGTANWLYFKEVLLVDTDGSNGSMTPYIGLGFRQWTDLIFTMQDKYFKSDGKTTVSSPDDPDYAFTETYYVNNTGTTVAVAVKQKDSDTTKYYRLVGTSRVASTLEEVSQLTESRKIAPTAASYANAYRDTYEFPDNKTFQTDYFYTRSYGYNYTNNISVPKNEVAVIDTNYTPTGWGKGMPITNISDGKNNTYIHTSWEVSSAKPLSLMFDFGQERTINRINFYCRNNNGMLETPKEFIVEGSIDGLNWNQIAAYDNAPRSGNNVTVNFDDATMRFCRIIISKAHQGNGNYFIVIGEVTFTHATEVMGGTLICPDNDMFTYNGNWYGAQAKSNFGHVYVGKKGSTVTFEFEGTRLGILSSPNYGADFEVTIDKKKVNSINLKEDNSPSYASFLSEALEKGKHTVTIKCKDVANIDSFVIYP